MHAGACGLGGAADVSEDESESEEESEESLSCGLFGWPDWATLRASCFGSDPPVAAVAAAIARVTIGAVERFTGFVARSALRSAESESDESDESAETRGRCTADLRTAAVSTCTSKASKAERGGGSHRSQSLGAPCAAWVGACILHHHLCPIPCPYFLWHSRWQTRPALCSTFRICQRRAWGCVHIRSAFLDQRRCRR